MMIRAQDYNYVVTYRPGKDIPVADTLSRVPTGESSHEEMVNNVTFSALKPDRLDSIRRATKQDETLVKLGEVIQNGWLEEKTSISSCTLPYFSYKDELSMQDGVIYRGGGK